MKGSSLSSDTGLVSVWVAVRTHSEDATSRAPTRTGWPDVSTFKGQNVRGQNDLRCIGSP